MPRAKKPWFRLYGEMVRDVKLRRLTPGQRWLWVVILAAASDSPVRGVLMLTEAVPLGWDDLVDASGLKLKEVESGTDLMQELDMIDFDSEAKAWFVPQWSERQYESDARGAHH